MVKIEIMIFNIKLYQHLYTDCRRLGQDGSTEIVCIYVDKNKENTESDFFTQIQLEMLKFRYMLSNNKNALYVHDHASRLVADHFLTCRNY